MYHKINELRRQKNSHHGETIEGEKKKKPQKTVAAI